MVRSRSEPRDVIFGVNSRHAGESRKERNGGFSPHLQNIDVGDLQLLMKPSDGEKGLLKEVTANIEDAVILNTSWVEIETVILGGSVFLSHRPSSGTKAPRFQAHKRAPVFHERLKVRKSSEIVIINASRRLVSYPGGPYKVSLSHSHNIPPNHHHHQRLPSHPQLHISAQRPFPSFETFL